MSREQLLREKLRKIEALFAGAATEGEKIAAGAAAELEEHARALEEAVLARVVERRRAVLGRRPHE